MIRSKKQSGSALLITLLIIAVITSIAVSVGRLMVSEIRMSGLSEESIGAYYAAESGLEHALWLYRVNHETAISKEYIHDGSTKDMEPYFDGNKVVYGVNKTEATPEKYPSIDSDTNAYYEILMWNKSENIGNLTWVSDPKNPILKKDDVLEIGAINNVDNPTSTITIRWGPYPDGSALSGDLEIIPIRADNGEVDYPSKRVVPLSPGNTTSISTANLSKIRIRNLGTDIRYTIEGAGGPNPGVDNGITTIDSIGYYNRTERKLRAEIDRNSGRIIGFYDFTLYAGEGSIP